MRLPVLVIACILLAWLWAWATAPLRRGLVFECPDAGAGQCWIVQGPGGGAVLVNCGSADASARPGQTAVRTLARLGVNRLEAVLLTRPAPDAASGVRDVLREFPCDTLLGAGDTSALPSALGWQPLRPGTKLRLRDGLQLEAVGRGGEVECVTVEWRQARVALVDRLSPECGRRLAEFRPQVVALSYSASREPAGLPHGLAPAVAVLSSGRSRATWADYGLRRSLEGAADRVFNTGRDGGVSIRIRGGRVEVRTAR